MNKTLLLLIILFPFFGYGQNYQCLQAGVKHYFTNDSGYLRGIRIDSVTTSGSNHFYYPFHTPRGSYSPIVGGLHMLDSTGGSWLGKKVIQLSDGTFLFDNLWHDTVVIKTQAIVGASWVFWRDTGVYYYQALVASADTMTIMGSLDSIKTINITAYNGTGIVSTDPLNSFRIILSKNHGFAQIFDLFTFPYQPNPASTLFPMGYDYFTDRLFAFTSLPTTGRGIFNITTLINPTYGQLYNWNVGDVFENSTCTPTVNSTGLYPYHFYVDTIISKTVLTTGTQYSFRGWIATQVINSWPPGTTVLDTTYPYATVRDTGSFFVPDSALLDTTLMPEEYLQKSFIYYWPNDTTWCTESAKYSFLPDYIRHDTLQTPIEGHAFTTYKTGVGLLHYYNGAPELAQPMLTDTTLVYYYQSSSGCGIYTTASPRITSVDLVNKPGSLLIFPNPATEELSIKTTLTQPYILTLQNMLGETVQTMRSTSKVQIINVAAIPAGVYNVSITYDVGSRYNEKVVIIH